MKWRIANWRIPLNMYTSYAAPTFSYGESIKNRMAEQDGKEYLLVGVGQVGGRVTPD